MFIDDTNKIEVRRAPGIGTYILVEGEKANEMMDEMMERLGMTVFYSTPTV